jgi:outer membrane immunogenic protein
MAVRDLPTVFGRTPVNRAVETPRPNNFTVRASHALVATVGLLALTGVTQSAFAADVPARPPVAKVPATTPLIWTGPYLGLHAGYGFGTARHDFFEDGLPAGNSDPISPAGFVGGVTAGYNWQYGSWVYGIEADISLGKLHDADPVGGFTGCFTLTCSSQVSRFGTLRGRAGAAVSGLFAYVTAGLAVGETQIVGTGFYDQSKNATGWTVGGGVETMIAQGWTAKAEYLYVDLGSNGLFYDPDESAEVKFRFHVVRMGFNRKF